MNNLKVKTLAFLSALSFSSGATALAQSKTTVTELYNVSGNCGMCKKTIESAASKTGASAIWDEEKKELKVSYNPKKTSADVILKNVAYAGYDNEKYLAPEAAYVKLPDCCQYTRTGKALRSQSEPQTHKTQDANDASQKSTMEQVYAAYFSLKDALVETNAPAASAKAKALLSDLGAVNMSALEAEQHTAFMKHLAPLRSEATRIAESKNINQQRDYFASLSQSMYELMKRVKPGYTVYLDHCPMFNDGKGADWISKESVIRNPYYGSQMMSCGKITETLKH